MRTYIPPGAPRSILPAERTTLIDAVRTFVKANGSALNPSWARTSCAFVDRQALSVSVCPSVVSLRAAELWPPRFRFSRTINTRFRVQRVWELPETLAKTRNQWPSVSRSRWHFHFGSPRSLRLSLRESSWRWSTDDQTRYETLAFVSAAKVNFQMSREENRGRKREGKRELFSSMPPTIPRDGCPGTTSSLKAASLIRNGADGSLRFNRS